MTKVLFSTFYTNRKVKGRENKVKTIIGNVNYINVNVKVISCFFFLPDNL